MFRLGTGWKDLLLFFGLSAVCIILIVLGAIYLSRNDTMVGVSMIITAVVTAVTFVAVHFYRLEAEKPSLLAKTPATTTHSTVFDTISSRKTSANPRSATGQSADRGASSGAATLESAAELFPKSVNAGSQGAPSRFEASQSADKSASSGATTLESATRPLSSRSAQAGGVVTRQHEQRSAPGRITSGQSRVESASARAAVTATTKPTPPPVANSSDTTKLAASPEDDMDIINFDDNDNVVFSNAHYQPESSAEAPYAELADVNHEVKLTKRQFSANVEKIRQLEKDAFLKLGIIF